MHLKASPEKKTVERNPWEKDEGENLWLEMQRKKTMVLEILLASRIIMDFRY